MQKLIKMELWYQLCEGKLKFMYMYTSLELKFKQTTTSQDTAGIETKYM